MGIMKGYGCGFVIGFRLSVKFNIPRDIEEGTVHIEFGNAKTQCSHPSFKLGSRGDASAATPPRHAQRLDSCMACDNFFKLLEEGINA